jgi:hypothetical protein
MGTHVIIVYKIMMRKPLGKNDHLEERVRNRRIASKMGKQGARLEGGWNWLHIVSSGGFLC